MTTTIEVPAEYGYVLASAVSTFFVNAFLSSRIQPYRKAAKIPYPYEYASYEQIQSAPPDRSKAMYQFNCAQRGHQNFVENMPSALGAMLIAGLQYPLVAAGLGALWSVNRVVYAIGYNDPNKDTGKGRYKGILWMLAHYGLVLTAAKSAYDFVVR
ncbi:membrane-associated proteins in eicosanoid and glutathione metabolism [Polyplosphaeria fusca]|uniref:Membrane-associated proteins in eicosanoid and glutathione metabolism n=1 Tax=Polyplosphaeria fusca TaxID=682080 RepID=A0A9P4QMZ7_9PLEO|nr:membrane-associated proteins in eicosanoid and glutathione metabolism [Polyplosphaeria fusca]